MISRSRPDRGRSLPLPLRRVPGSSIPSIRVPRATNRRARGQVDALVLETVRKRGGRQPQARRMQLLPAAVDDVPNVLHAFLVLPWNPRILVLQPQRLLCSWVTRRCHLICALLTKFSPVMQRDTHCDNDAFVLRNDTGVLPTFSGVSGPRVQCVVFMRS
jgi:hypothetical protein